MCHPAIQLVCFDLGGVLVRIVENWSHACRRAGAPDLPVFRDAQSRRLLAGLNANYEVGLLDPEEMCEQVCLIVPQYTPTQIRAIMDAWLLEPYPGVDALLGRLDEAEPATACLSNTNVVHWQMQFGAGAYAPLKRLQHRFASCHIGFRKPQAQAFAHVEQATGVEPGAILFFDDLATNVAAAQRRGWQAQQVDPAGDVCGQIEQHLRQHRVL